MSKKIITFPSEHVDRIKVDCIEVQQLINTQKLKVGAKEYDGSATVEIEASDLGLANALHFIGVTTTSISDNSATDTITVNSKSHTAVAGDVVLYGDNEYVFNGDEWLELGDGSSHALKSITIKGENGLTGNGTLSSDVTLSHANTSTQTSISANGRTYITGVALDDYGHVTGLTTGAETVTNTWRGIQDNLTSTSTTDSLSAKQGKELKTLVDDKVTANSAITAATKCKITYDTKGLVTAGAELAASDIPNLAASKITSGTFADARIASASTWNAKQDAITSSNKLSAGLVSGLANVATSGAYSDLTGKLTLAGNGNATTAAKSDHTHTTTIASSTGTNEITLAHGGKYAITAGGDSFVFTMPADNNTDTKVKVTTGTTTKAYILGVNNTKYSSGSATDSIITDTGIYLDTTEGRLTAGSFNATSDARLKENFKPLTVEKSILELPTYKFDFIDGAKNQIGCKAQELQEICPEIVNEDSDGYLSIQESKIVYLLLDEIKKLRKEINELKAR